MKSVALITYDTYHLKTEQVAIGLMQKGYDNLRFFALPFVDRPTRKIIFAHRPDMSLGAHSAFVANKINASYTTVASADAIPADAADFFLIVGAGLLPETFVNATAGRVINAHPGIIPLVRGLDSFKWAILDGNQVGNTLHFIDAEADAGEVFARHKTPCFKSDDLERFAARHYEMEINMLVDFERYLEMDNAVTHSDPYPIGPARMRMKIEDQQRLDSAFDIYKRTFAEIGY